MKGAIARGRLVGAAALARSLGMVPGRAERFRSRSSSTTVPTIAEMRTWPRWPREPEPEQRRIFGVTALRAADDALRAVISGETLRAYAAEVGEMLLEHVLARPGQGALPLPSAEGLTAAGKAHAHRALPPRLAERFGVTATHDRVAARHVSEAEALVSLAPMPGAEG